MFATTKLTKEVEDMNQPTKKNERSKALSKEHDDKNQYGFESNVVSECANIDNQEEATKHELDYLVRDLALHPNREEVVDDKYINKEQRNFIRKPRKVKMKLHQQRKRNKHGPFSKKVKMKCFVVSLVET